MRLQHDWPIVRTRIAPGLFNNANALAWFYYVVLLLPLIAAAILCWQLWTGRLSRDEAAVVAPLLD